MSCPSSTILAVVSGHYQGRPGGGGTLSRLTEGVLAKPTALDRRFSSGSQTWTVLTVQEIIEGEKVSQEIVIKAFECNKS